LFLAGRGRQETADIFAVWIEEKATGFVGYYLEVPRPLLWLLVE